MFPVFRQVPLLVSITGGQTVHPPIDELLTPTDIELTPFRNSASKVTGLQVHATTPGRLNAVKQQKTILIHTTT